MYGDRQQQALLSNRFQIEDIVTQSTSGVVFHATDVETGRRVAVRRFFPSGIRGGGLPPAEQAVFRAAVERLAGLAHPALRTVVGGGCDPVDGIPFMVTEWVAGNPLSEWLKNGPLQPQEAITVLAAALDVSQLLSRILGHEAVWIETSLSSIVVGDEDSGRGITFWISTSRWLDGRGSRVNLTALVHLAEDLLGWRGRAPSGKSGHGLGHWFQWLRAHAKSTDLATARAKLEGLSQEPPAPVATTVTTTVAAKPAALAPAPESPGPVPQEIKIAMPSTHGPLILAGIAALVVGGAAWWFVSHRPQPSTPGLATTRPAVSLPQGPAGASGEAAPAPSAEEAVQAEPVIDPEAAAIAAANARATALRDELERRGQAPRRPGPPRQGRPTPRAGDQAPPVFAAEQVEGIMARRNREVIVEGMLGAVLPRSNRIHLEFAKPGPVPTGFGILYLDTARQPEIKAALDTWVGKRIRIEGKVDIEHSNVGGTRMSRPKIIMKSPDAVTLAEGA